jgi:hypothetical protein
MNGGRVRQISLTKTNFRFDDDVGKRQEETWVKNKKRDQAFLLCLSSVADPDPGPF